MKANRRYRGGKSLALFWFSGRALGIGLFRLKTSSLEAKVDVSEAQHEADSVSKPAQAAADKWNRVGFGSLWGASSALGGRDGPINSFAFAGRATADHSSTRPGLALKLARGTQTWKRSSQ
jgi:hypothetical protein